MLAFAMAQVGDGYAYGSTGPHRWDCSGLVQAAYRRAGKRLPRVSGAQAGRGYRISWSQARPGDLIAGQGHVGIYAGKRRGRHMMVDAGSPGVGVVYRPVYRNSQGLHPRRVR